MTRIIGLDLSLASTGVALPDGTTTTIRPVRYAQTGRRLNELFGYLWKLLETHRPQLAIVEGHSLHSPGELGKCRRAEWVGCARLALERLRVPYVDVAPTKLKTWATGSGHADKDAMVTAAHAAGGRPANHDEADAYLLRAIGVLIVDDLDLFDDSSSVARRRRLADDLAWPDEILEAASVRV